MENRKVRITWNGTGGELDSRTVEGTDEELDTLVRDELIALISGEIVSAGDTFEIREVEL